MRKIQWFRIAYDLQYYFATCICAVCLMMAGALFAQHDYIRAGCLGVLGLLILSAIGADANRYRKGYFQLAANLKILSGEN
jgi:hypothetical protein